ncbi:hypothetical protein IV460_00725 [Enterococcus casseliflavus]|uniref:hypothetical protein n=1 Tax=Enterococcus casseliflavus TaxID=37734 RepID=UPI001E4020F2|nr:hypothetical protein [Enterococcus casseliflavus]MCD5189580.1 hypothetical protein [Enterococcus casseliflavus]MDT2960412.1 hypothetical protein [Enterococcus casseliflavus]
MRDSVKQNVAFFLAIILLILVIYLPSFQVPLAILAGISSLVFLYYLAKMRIKAIIYFFRGM